MESFFYILQRHAKISSKISKEAETQMIPTLEASHFQILFYVKTVEKKYNEVLEISQRKESEEAGREKKTSEYPLQEYIKYKFKYMYEMLINNMFLRDEQKQENETIFYKTQRTYHTIKRVLYNYRFKKAPTKIQTDLCLNVIDPGHANTFTFFKNRVKYCFSVRDLVHIIINAITHCHDFFMEPMDPKNPYTNLPFSRADLYNMYFRIKNSNHIIPPMIVNYFLLGFDLDMFIMNNETTIREYAIKKYVMNSPPNVMYNEILDMIDEFFECMMTVKKEKVVSDNKIIKVNKKVLQTIHLDNEFPRDRLIHIMRPYLFMSLMSTHYIMGTEKRDTAKRIFKYMVKRFIVYNPNFGRKCINVVIGNTKDTNSLFSFDSKLETKFNDDHPPMTMKDAENLFSKKGELKYGYDIPERNTFRNEIRRRRNLVSNPPLNLVQVQPVTVPVPTSRHTARPPRRNSAPRNNTFPGLIPPALDIANLAFEPPAPTPAHSPLPLPLPFTQNVLDLLEEISTTSETSNRNARDQEIYNISVLFEPTRQNPSSNRIARNPEVYDISGLFEPIPVSNPSTAAEAVRSARTPNVYISDIDTDHVLKKPRTENNESNVVVQIAESDTETKIILEDILNKIISAALTEHSDLTEH